MDILKTKLNHFRDLSHQHYSTLQSLAYVKNTFENVVDQIEKQIRFRLTQKLRMKTKIGVSVRENVLQLINTTVSMVHEAYCLSQDIYRQLAERQLSIEEVIKHGDPLIKDIEYLSTYINQANLKVASADTAIKTQEESFIQHCRLRQLLTESTHDKENYRGENGPQSKREPSDKYKLNMLLISREGSESFLKASLKLKQFQIMELSLVVDECLQFVSDMSFLKEKFKAGQISRSVSRSRKSIAHRVSLGIESLKPKSEEIDLLCDEDITVTFPLPIANKSISDNLQRITQREEEHQSDSPSKKQLTFGLVPRSPCLSS